MQTYTTFDFGLRASLPPLFFSFFFFFFVSFYFLFSFLSSFLGIAPCLNRLMTSLTKPSLVRSLVTRRDKQDSRRKCARSKLAYLSPELMMVSAIFQRMAREVAAQA